MSPLQYGLKVLGLSLVAIVGLMAFMALGATSEGKRLHNLRVRSGTERLQTDRTNYLLSKEINNLTFSAVTIY